MRLLSIQCVAALALLTSVAAAQAQPPVGQAVPLAGQTPPVDGAKPLVVQDAWVRATSGVDIAAAYMTLRNAGTAPITVTGVESPIAGHSMIHETKVEGGQSTMRPHEQLAIAPGATVRLQPGGLHVMMHDLKRPLAVGEKVPLVLQLSGGGTVGTTATVRPLTAE